LPSQKAAFEHFESHPHEIGDEEDFQMYPHNGMNYINYLNFYITLDNRTAPCPDNVFLWPQPASFKISNVFYEGLKLRLLYVETQEPLLNIRVNWQLQP